MRGERPPGLGIPRISSNLWFSAGRTAGGYGKNGVLSLYESWHAAEPGKGYGAKAAEWRAKLPKADESETAKP